MIGIALIIGFIIYRMYKKGRAITDAYIVASEKAFAVFALDPYGVLKKLCQSGDDFPISERVLNDYELFKDFQFATQTLSRAEKDEISLAMISLITVFIYSSKPTEKNFNDVKEDLKHNFEFNDAFKDARRNVLFLYGILYLN